MEKAKLPIAAHYAGQHWGILSKQSRDGPSCLATSDGKPHSTQPVPSTSMQAFLPAHFHSHLPALLDIEALVSSLMDYRCSSSDSSPPPSHCRAKKEKRQKEDKVYRRNSTSLCPTIQKEEKADHLSKKWRNSRYDNQELSTARGGTTSLPSASYFPGFSIVLELTQYNALILGGSI